jgi:hypothetical protein
VSPVEEDVLFQPPEQFVWAYLPPLAIVTPGPLARPIVIELRSSMYPVAPMVEGMDSTRREPRGREGGEDGAWNSRRNSAVPASILEATSTQRVWVSGQHTVDSGQWTAYSVQRTVDSAQRTAHSGQQTVDSRTAGQRAVDSVQRTAYSGQRTGKWRARARFALNNSILESFHSSKLSRSQFSSKNPYPNFSRVNVVSGIIRLGITGWYL